MPVIWNLKKWLAVEHNIYRPSQLQVLLAEKAGVQLSLQAVSTLLNGTPNALRLHTMQALCNALHCSLSDFCEVLPDGSASQPLRAVSPTNAQELQSDHSSSDLVSDKTIDNVDVDPVTREIILRILQEQGLIPRAAAPETPSSSQRRLIGMLFPTWAWSFIIDLARGIVEEIAQTPYDLVLYSINDRDLEMGEQEVVDRLRATQLTAGLLAIFPSRASRPLTRLYEQGFPVVIIDDQETQTVPWVRADNATGAYMAVRHLINLGHRRIAHIQGPPEYLASQDRYNGYRRALLEAGVTPDPDLVLTGDFTPPSGKLCARQLFSLPLDKRPSAIFAAADQMAYGVLMAAEEYGLSIPQDIALVGFDDDTPSAHTRPALTTVHQPYLEMGQQGIRLLLSMLDTHSVASSKEASTAEAKFAQSRYIQLPTSLVVRASCGANYRSSIMTPSDKIVLE
ncbi:MAG TPA: substrate-binding domain-containing protein [Ktedonobacteraceae bacterium]|nr:substrate-binding domain-containing protein [Ktedonobacteraceae bacterium]